MLNVIRKRPKNPAIATAQNTQSKMANATNNNAAAGAVNPGNNGTPGQAQEGAVGNGYGGAQPNRAAAIAKQ